MNRAEAHAVLDAARDGASVPRRLITAALRVTGDFQPRRVFAWRRSSNPRSSDAEPTQR